jgi:hypothetical protein
MKTKSGLQKPISSIFESIPQTKSIENDETEMPSASAIQSHDPPKPTIAPSQMENVIPKPQEEGISPPMQYSDLVPAETDRKPKQQLWLKNMVGPLVAAIFAIATILTTAGMMGVFTSYEQVTIADTPVIPTEPVAQEAPAIDWRIPKPVEVSSINVTSSSDNSKTIQESIIVKGILYGTEKSLVIIGTEVCMVGDNVAGATIINIDRKSVEFERNSERWTQKVQ